MLFLVVLIITCLMFLLQCINDLILTYYDSVVAAVFVFAEISQLFVCLFVDSDGNN